MFEFIGQRDSIPAGTAVTTEELREQLSLCEGEESDTLLQGLRQRIEEANRLTDKRTLRASVGQGLSLFFPSVC